MSHDFLVVTRRRPAVDTIEAFALGAQTNVELTGAFRAGANVPVSNDDPRAEMAGGHPLAG